MYIGMGEELGRGGRIKGGVCYGSKHMEGEGRWKEERTK